MAYTPTTWTTGDTITASAMNKIESGIANAGNVLIVDYDTGSLNKTVQEIYNAIVNGVPVYMRMIYGTLQDYQSEYKLAPITALYKYSSDTFRIGVNYPKSFYSASAITNRISLFKPCIWVFQATSMSDYPSAYTMVTMSDNDLTDN